ncbi:MAG: hypothetical protein DRR16_22295 [Candidatus Parabeggiatoa sp. nov. 3]|nr:MAG: hypothetical protein DRR00_18295 [Gammaproteobacteria bacterium]RKZ64845.1 MAG: hypothetical protein DRQ99_14460 [Gammaproteobacteria bacterium]RKZ81365.1 MAG: hypothetical protein DRR16_22295 [Gammaproteobacteria bacterium]
MENGIVQRINGINGFAQCNQQTNAGERKSQYHPSKAIKSSSQVVVTNRKSANYNSGQYMLVGCEGEVNSKAGRRD